MNSISNQARNMYHAAEKFGRYDAGGILIEIIPGSSAGLPLVISCSGVVPGKIMYAMEATASSISANKIFICDVKSEWYQNGIQGFTSSFRDTLNLISEIISLMAPIRVYTVGTSAGGFMAMALAASVGSERALALGPQTIIEPEWLNANGDTRWESNMARIHADGEVAPFWDVRKLIHEKASSFSWRKPQYLVLYSGLDHMDKRHALRLAGVRGVKLLEVMQSGHNVAAFLRETRCLEQLITDFIIDKDFDYIITELRNAFNKFDVSDL